MRIENNGRVRLTRSALIQAAETQFVQLGFDGARMDSIVDISGLSKGALYKHFRDKEDLFLSVFRERMEPYQHALVRSLGAAHDVKEGRIIFRQFCADLLLCREVLVLALEATLFALRHPPNRIKSNRPLAGHWALAFADRNDLGIVNLTTACTLCDSMAALAMSYESRGIAVDSAMVREASLQLFDSFVPVAPVRLAPTQSEFKRLLA